MTKEELDELLQQNNEIHSHLLSKLSEIHEALNGALEKKMERQVQDEEKEAADLDVDSETSDDEGSQHNSDEHAQEVCTKLFG